MSIMFLAPKIHALIPIPASEASRPLATYVARARNFARIVDPADPGMKYM